MKVHIKHFAGDYYTIRYAKHWWLPMRAVREMKNLGLHALTPAWTDAKLFTFNEAKRVAQKLKDMTPAEVTETERRFRSEVYEFETRRRSNLNANRAREFWL